DHYGIAAADAETEQHVREAAAPLGDVPERVACLVACFVLANERETAAILGVGVDDVPGEIELVGNLPAELGDAFFVEHARPLLRTGTLDISTASGNKSFDRWSQKLNRRSPSPRAAGRASRTRPPSFLGERPDGPVSCFSTELPRSPTRRFRL